MRKILLLIIVIIQCVCVCACVNNKQLENGDNMVDKRENIIYLNSMSVYLKDDMYLVVIEQEGQNQKRVEFSKQRKASKVLGLELQRINSIREFLGKDIKEVETALGEVHVDIGSGFYIPSYITVDGFLISFLIDNNIIYEVVKRDLLTGEIIERVCKL